MVAARAIVTVGPRGPDLRVSECGREVQKTESVLWNDELCAGEVCDWCVGGAAPWNEFDHVVEPHCLFEHGAGVAGVEMHEVVVYRPGIGRFVAELSVKVGL